jgi:hypothetical protein
MDAESRSMGMLLQQLPKKAFVVIYSLFFILWVVILFIGIFLGIHYWDSTDAKSTWGCDEGVTNYDSLLCNGVDLFTNGTQWTGLIKNVDKLRRELYLSAAVANPNLAADTHTTLNWTVSIRGTDSNSTFNTTEADWSESVSSTKTRDLYCEAGKDRCDEIVLVHELYIRYSTYEVNVSLQVEPSDDTFNTHPDIFMTFYYVSRAYTLLQLWFRFIWLVLTFVVIIVFAHRLRHTSWKDWTLEQRWTSILLFAILGYANPFFALTILVAGWFPIFLDSVLAATFYCLLLLFWLILFDGITKESRDRGWFKFYFWKILLVGLTWIAMVTVYTWMHLHNLDDPNYDLTDLPGFIFFEVILIIMLCVYILWLFWLFFRSCNDLKQKSYLGTRIRAFGGLTVFTMLVTIASLIFGWAQPNVGLPASSETISAVSFMGTIALYHLYIYVLCIFYLPLHVSSGGSKSDYGMQRLEDAVEQDSSGEAAPEVDLPAEDVSSTVSESE